MAANIARGDADAVIDAIVSALKSYEAEHPEAQIDLYRQNSVSVRVRIVDPDFAEKNKVERSKLIWEYLNDLPDDVQADISALILLAPDEMGLSLANFEFENPIPSAVQ